MDFIHKLLNLVLPVVTIFLFIFVLPANQLFKLFKYCVRFIFPENLTGSGTHHRSFFWYGRAYGYAKNGARLALIARRGELLEVVTEKVKELGSPDVVVILADVSKLHDCKRFVNETINHFGSSRMTLHGMDSFACFKIR